MDIGCNIPSHLAYLRLPVSRDHIDPKSFFVVARVFPSQDDTLPPAGKQAKVEND